MKALLFVQNEWNKRPPRMQWRVPMSVSWDALVGWIREGSFCPTIATASAVRAARRADRWWLVECANARWGREAIASGRVELRSGFHGNGSMLVGRVIACGGRGESCTSNVVGRE